VCGIPYTHIFGFSKINASGKETRRPVNFNVARSTSPENVREDRPRVRYRDSLLETAREVTTNLSDSVRLLVGLVFGS